MLFAFWGATENKYVEKNDDKIEKLFNSDIEARQYGPVIPSIYSKFKLENGITFVEKISNIFCEDIGEDKRNAFESLYIVLTQECFDVLPFTLVEITHSDKCWRKPYNGLTNVKKIMSPKEIFSEYANQV